MVWKRDDGGADAQDHGRMDLAVGVGVEGAFMLQIRDMHRNHGGLFLLDVEILAQAVLDGVIEVHGVTLAAQKLLDVLLLEQDLSIVHDEQWSLNSAWVCEESHLLVGDVSDD